MYAIRATPNPLDTYCNICNPFQYATDIMTNDKLRTEHIKDIAGSLRGHQGGTISGGFDREAERLHRWSPGVFEARTVRRLHGENRDRSAGEPEAVARHRDLHHVR